MNISEILRGLADKLDSINVTSNDNADDNSVPNTDTTNSVDSEHGHSHTHTGTDTHGHTHDNSGTVEDPLTHSHEHEHDTSGTGKNPGEFNPGGEDSMIPPLQQEIEILKKSAGLPSEYDDDTKSSLNKGNVDNTEIMSVIDQGPLE